MPNYNTFEKEKPKQPKKTKKRALVNVQLIVSDMDGTLLDENHCIPPRFWPLLNTMHERGIYFAPASGRQLFTLQEQFSAYPQLPIIAENGAVVSYEGEIISLVTMNTAAVHTIVHTVASNQELDWGAVVCRADGAFISRSDQAFIQQCTPYYKKLTVVPELSEYINDQVVKVAIYCFQGSRPAATTALSGKTAGLLPIVSSGNWIDFMNPAAHKGNAVATLAKRLDITLDNTIAFGDYLNDLELLRTVGRSYAMANAHPELLAIATHQAPAHTEEGVIQVLEQVLTQAC
ncbi:Cof-type HAD-IIB family hydrolase [Corynebacterium sp. sy039]|uniref:Cof-type HAD-IIB family hydrolase n=1 Tax=Corynebacterium sp. sy039 TaxID=2599641 RepID=UPI001FED903C|nr:Cof-type HAD-IIB family hydrolase [Corynebacterium sp. sy039]